jgi:hypothetical protein
MDAEAHARVSPWVVTFAVMLATFMEVLDTTVVNVSIPHIAGNLAATMLLARRTQMHQNVLVGNITAGNLESGRMLQGMQGWFHANGVDQYVASRRAWATLYGMVQRHASMLSFVEAFWVMGVLFLVMLPFILFLRNPRPKAQRPSPRPAAEEITEIHEELQDEELLLVH